jgi:hypothetical protein
MEAKTTQVVQVLTIQHKHGTDMWVCATPELALAYLDGFVREWWESELDDEMPESEDERIKDYFEGVDEESYSICAERVLDGSEFIEEVSDVLPGVRVVLKEEKG